MMMRCRPFLWTTGIITVLTAPVLAQVSTDGSVGPAQSLNGPDFQIGGELGTQAGSNLFHSFEQFSIRTGESATFSGPNGIENIIGRVTGGDGSLIDGRLASTIPGADLWLFNPAGVVFGPNASLDLTGSFHVSTADEVRLKDGSTFNASQPTGNGFSVAAPEAFGFLSADPAGIALTGSELIVKDGEALSLVGGDIDIAGAEISAEAGTINLLAAGGPGIANVESGTLTTAVRGNLTVTEQANVATVGDGGGLIQIRGGSFVVDGESTVADFNTGSIDAQGGMDVDVQSLAVRGSSDFGSQSSGEGTGGDTVITARTIEVSDRANIVTNSIGPGAGGNIEITADRVDVANAGNIRTLNSQNAITNGGGDIAIAAAAVDVDTGGRISTAKFGLGGSGDVAIAADRVDVRNAGAVETITSGPGDGGDLAIDAGKIALTAAGTLNTIVSGFEGETAGNGGDITLSADRLDVTGTRSGINSRADNTGNGGDVVVIAKAVNVSDSGKIETVNEGSGTGGDITISSGNVQVQDFGKISTRTDGSGNGGNTVVVADRLTLLESGSIASANGVLSEGGTGNGGDIRVTAGTVELRGNGRIETIAESSGIGGNVAVAADRIELSERGAIETRSNGTGEGGDIGITAPVLSLNNGRIATRLSNAGRGGSITLDIRNLTLRDGSIEATDFGELATGQGGDIAITADTIELLANGELEFAQISTEFLQRSNGGDIDIKTNRLFAVGTADILSGARIGLATGTLDLINGASISADPSSQVIGGPTANITADRIRIDAQGGLTTGIFFNSSAENAEQSGELVIRTGGLEILNGGRIATSTRGVAGSGDITITADTIAIRDDESSSFVGIESSHDGEIGNAGDITINANSLSIDGTDDLFSVVEGADPFPRAGILSNGGGLADAFSSGGAISINVGQIDINNGLITSATSSDGTAGTVSIAASQSLTLQGRSEISSNAGTFSTGDAGAVRINTGDLTILDDSLISSTSFASGDAGSITINALTTLIDNRNSEEFGGITTQVTSLFEGNSTGNAGNIDLTTGRLVLRDTAQISSTSFGAGNAGAITINAGDILISSSLEEGPPGTVPSTSISTSVADADSAGVGGPITIRADRLILRGETSEINAANNGTGVAGTVDIGLTDRLLLAGGSSIVTSSSRAGGGNINVDADNVITAVGTGSGFSTSVGDDTGNAGNIALNAPIVALGGSLVLARAEAGQGGDIQITSDDLILSPGTLISAEAGSAGVDGTIAVSAPDADLSGGLVVLENALNDAASRLDERCRSQRDAGTSSFTAVGQGGLAPTPDDVLASTYAPDMTIQHAETGDWRFAVFAADDQPARPKGKDAGPCKGKV